MWVVILNLENIIFKLEAKLSRRIQILNFCYSDGSQAMDADFDQLHVIVPLILALLLVLVAIAGFAVCIKRSKKAFSDLPFYIITFL